MEYQQQKHNITTENSDIQQYLNDQSFHHQNQQYNIRSNNHHNIQPQQQYAFQHQNNNFQQANLQQQYPYNNQQQFVPQQQQEKKLLALVQLDIGNGTKTIKIFEGDDLRQISIDFCLKNNLNEDCVDFLVENIKKQINVHKSRKTSQNNSFSLQQSQKKPLNTSYNNINNQNQQKQKQNLMQQQQQQQQYNIYQQQQQQNQQSQIVNTSRDNQNTNTNINLQDPHSYNTTLNTQNSDYYINNHLQSPYNQKNSQNSPYTQKSQSKIHTQSTPKTQKQKKEQDLAQHYEKQYQKMLQKQQNHTKNLSKSPMIHKSELDRQRSQTPKIKSKKTTPQTSRLDLNTSTNTSKNRVYSKSPIVGSKHKIQKGYVKSHQQQLQKNQPQMYNNKPHQSQKEFIIHGNHQNNNNISVNGSFTSRNKSPNSKDNQVYDQLYQNAVRKQQNRQNQYIEKQLREEELENKELEECTFHPTISPRSQQIQRDEKIEDILIQAQKKKQYQKSIGQKLKEEQEQKNCTFSPYVSDVSRQLINEDRTKERIYNLYGKDFDQQHIEKYLQTGEIHERLYHQAAFDDIRKNIWQNEQYYKHYPHSPDLGPNKDRKVPEKTQKEFIERLQREKQILDEKMEEKRIIENLPFDKVTGQKLFQPKINKNDPIYQKVSAEVDYKKKLYKQKMLEEGIQPEEILHDKEGSTRPYKQPWQKQLRSPFQPLFYPNSTQNLQQKKSQRKQRSLTPTTKSSNHNTPLNPNLNNTLHISITHNNNPNNQRSLTPQPQKQNSNSPQQNIQNVFNISHNSLNQSQYPQQQQQQQQLKSQRKLFGSSRDGSKNSRKSRKSNNTESPDFVKPVGQRQKSSRPVNMLMVSFDTIQPHLKIQLKKLFDGLDGDGDGQICAANIDLSTIQPEELEIIQDILYQMEDDQIKLDFPKFTEKLIQKDLVKPMMKLYNLVPEYELAEDPTPSDYDVIRQRILKEQELKEQNELNKIMRQNKQIQQQQDVQSIQSINDQDMNNKIDGNLTDRYKKIVMRSMQAQQFESN